MVGLHYFMFPRVQFVMLRVAVALLVIAAILGVISMLPQKWLEAQPEPTGPLAVELIEPGRTGPARPCADEACGC